jgi:uncharacterized membrane protein
MSPFSAVEQRIREIEHEVPIELRVAVSSRPLRSSVGGLRGLIACLASATLCIDLFWLPMPVWLAPVLCLAASWLPSGILARVPWSRMFLSASSRSRMVQDDALGTFRTLKMDAPPAGHALLIYFCTTERQFTILPDSQLERTWPKEHWQACTQRIALELKDRSRTSTEDIARAVLGVLDDIRGQAITRLGPRKPLATSGGLPSDPDGLLPNTVVMIS